MLKFKASILLALFLFLFSCGEEEKQVDSKPNIKKLSPVEFHSKLQEIESYELVDVRTPGEFESGYIKNAENINISSPNFEENIKKLDRNTPVFLYCRSGSRSGRAATLLAQYGFMEIYDLSGGITAWNSNELPVETKDGSSLDQLKGLSKSQFMSLVSNKNKTVLVDFYAEWCAPCKKLSPMLKDIEKEYSDKMELVKIDVDSNQTIAQELKIQGLPTMHIYKNGEKVWEYLGLTNRRAIEDAIKSNL